MFKYWTGVGSRKAPLDILNLMTRIGVKLFNEGWILRSGDADGSDKAFAFGVPKHKRDIYYAHDATEEAMIIARTYHSAWNRCSEYAKKLHGRNAFQVLGRDLKTPSKFAICWTPDGCIHHNERTMRSGGTGTAISIASMNNIPVFNLQRIGHRYRIQNWLKGEK